MREDSAREAESRGYEAFAKRRHFGSLDGLRGLSILSVILFHCSVFPGGYLGVQLFFVISGFLITTLLLREKHQFETVGLRRFYARRALRIAPLYYGVLSLYVVLVWATESGTPAGRAFFANLPAFLTYTSNWFVPSEPGPVIFYFAWSLAVEEQFYLVWPWVEKYLGGWRALACLGPLMISAYALRRGFGGLDPLIATALGSAPAIGWGVLLAHLLDDRRGFGWAERFVGLRGAAPVLLLGLGLSIGAGASREVLDAQMVLLVGACVIREDHGLALLFRQRWIAHIGIVSYGLYLLHMLSHHVAGRALNSIGLSGLWLETVATCVVAWAVATLSHRYFESPFLRWKAAFRSDGPSPKAAQSQPLRETVSLVT